VDDDHFDPEPCRVVLRDIKDLVSGEIVDHALVTYFKAPRSFTGEDVVEISCHGSPVIQRHIIDLILHLDGRLASPGEFTLRALANKKLNLSQAEAIRDLINAQTNTAAVQAARQLRGELAAILQPFKEDLIRIIVIFESAVEFSEDDLPAPQTQEIRQELADMLLHLRKLASTFATGHLLHDGLRVAIVGAPNAGKSSLFNRLLGMERAIVTAHPGTTRDSLTEPISLGGIPVLLTDTAGIREAHDQIEGIGIDRTRQVMADADLLLIVIDGSKKLMAEDRELVTYAKDARHLIALNKADLPSFSSRLSDDLDTSSRIVEVSALTGAGFDQLSAAILEPFGSVDSQDAGLLITDSRHHDLLRRTHDEIQAAVSLLTEEASEELVLVGLHNALRLLGEITGETTTEELLSTIFATFCVGK
jgi:tRNA modification GTPase